MRPRTFAREIAFQVLYQDDLNPPAEARPQDALLDQGQQTRRLMQFVGQMAEVEDAGPAGDGPLRTEWLRDPALVEFTRALVAGHFVTFWSRIIRLSEDSSVGNHDDTG